MSLISRIYDTHNQGITVVLFIITPSDLHEEFVLLVPAIFRSMSSEIWYLVQKYFYQENTRSSIQLNAIHPIISFLLLVQEIFRQGNELLSWRK